MVLHKSTITTIVLFLLISVKEAEVCKTRASQRAKLYLEKHYAEMIDVYQTAITAYALHLVGSSESSQIFTKLDKMKISGERARKPHGADCLCII